MSVECGECEMDARSYHAPGCSRYRPERAISQYLVDGELIHPAEVEEVERQVLRVLAEERARLREKVQEMADHEQAELSRALPREAWLVHTNLRATLQEILDFLEP